MIWTLAMALFAQVECSRTGGRCPDARDGRPNKPRYAFFEFAPTGGAGMTAPCACTTPTGAKGEAMTFTRASSGTCLKGSVTTGIAAGDLVTCSTNQARVMPGGDGTGVLGLLVEPERTNLALRSEALNNAAWTASNAGASVAPTVTADFAVAPDGATTAERVQFSACANAGADASILYQISLGTTGSNSGSIFCKGTSASQSISVCIADGGGTNDVCVPVTCTNTSWTLISKAASVTTSGGLVLGCNNLTGVYSGASSTGAADVLLWGGQYEAGAFPSSYIATAGATATRALDVGTFTLSGSITDTSGSWAGTIYSPTTMGAVFMALGAGTAGSALVLVDNTRAATYDTTNLVQVTGLSSTVNRSVRVAGSWSGSTLTAFADSSSNTGSYDGTMISSTTMYVGTYSTGASAINGVINQVCVDPSPSRCR